MIRVCIKIRILKLSTCIEIFKKELYMKSSIYIKNLTKYTELRGKIYNQTKLVLTPQVVPGSSDSYQNNLDHVNKDDSLN